MQYIIQYPNSKLLSKNRSIIQYTKHYPLPNYPASKVLSIIQSNIHYPPHCPLFQALFNIPNYPPKPEHYLVYPTLSIIQLSSIQGLIHPISKPYSKHYPLSKITSNIYNQNPEHYLVSKAISNIKSNIQILTHRHPIYKTLPNIQSLILFEIGYFQTIVQFPTLFHIQELSCTKPYPISKASSYFPQTIVHYPTHHPKSMHKSVSKHYTISTTLFLNIIQNPTKSQHPNITE